MFVIYNRVTTYLLIDRRTRTMDYATERAAKAALTRAVKKGKVENRDDYAIADRALFHREIEKQEIKKNLLTGLEFSQPVNTPAVCDPSTETYHCF